MNPPESCIEMKSESINKLRSLGRPFILLGFALGFWIAVAGCTSEETLEPLSSPVLEHKPSTPVINNEQNLERDSPRPAAVSPLPPTWTVQPAARPTQPPFTPASTQSEIPSDSPSDAIYYIVQEGDTLGEIAEQFKVALEDLARANDLEDIDHIEEGQELIIP